MVVVNKVRVEVVEADKVKMEAVRAEVQAVKVRAEVKADRVRVVVVVVKVSNLLCLRTNADLGRCGIVIG